MKKISFLLILLVLGTLTIDVLAHKGKPTADTPITTTINDSYIDSNTGLLKYYRIQSDTRGGYKNGVDSVASIIQGIGDWELDTKPSTVRKVFLDFRDPISSGISGQNPSAPFQSALVPLRFISKCAEVGINMRTLILNQIVQCPLAISLTYGGAIYAVRMNANYPGTEFVQWTCVTQNGLSQCISWQMEPSVFRDGEFKNRGQLIKVATNRRETDQLLGQFYFSFKIDVSN